MSSSLVHINKVQPSIYNIELNRPDKRNALNIPLLEELCLKMNALNKDPTVRVLVLSGAGSVFCAGLDLGEAAEPARSKRSAELIASMLSMVHNSPHVTIAAVHGAAVAGGAGLMCACDLVVASEDTKFGFPETQKGLVAAQVLTFLSRQLRERDIRELLLLGELIDCQRALALGLINRIVAPEDLLLESIRLGKQSLLGAPRATALTKKLIDDIHPSNFDEDLRKALIQHELARDSDEAQEGIYAFLENRLPAWAESKSPGDRPL